MPDPISWQLALPYLVAALLFGYLVGSTPFGLIFSRLAGLGDIRKIGSGNIGATNVLRSGNKKVAFLTLLGDILKGTKKPPECPLFKTVCTPIDPVGACMVSSEGTCAAYYRYHRDDHSVG